MFMVPNFPQLRSALMTALMLSLGACSIQQTRDSRIAELEPYKIEVRQGNWITPEMVAQLKPGMSREQVRFVLGSPLLSDVFHADRWDYVYAFRSSKGVQQEQRFTVFFSQGKLVRSEGDVTAATSSSPTNQLIEITAPTAQ
jgi:outer membrane protein assembly factor BamE